MKAVCRHFGACGGCALQDLAPDIYLQRKRALIVAALARYGIFDPPLREITPVPPRSRRRATLKIEKKNSETHIGFHAARSHALIDILECHVLTPALFTAARGIARMLSPFLRDGDDINVYLVEAQNGIDLALQRKRRAIPELTAAIAAAAPALNIVRVTSGNDLLFQTAAPEVCVGKAAMKIPLQAFLQPTREGEQVVLRCVTDAVGKAKRIADLFSGCGTFSLPLAERARIHAVDADAPMLAALAGAARVTSGLKPITIERRDLFALPLSAAELKTFDAVLLDPPRAGALAQAKQLAKSGIRRIAYVSCDAASFARDARVLLDGGYRLDWIVGVDQFLWSAHIELAAAFSRN
ncbi:MAG: class I SAM-dependent RNA methyltransferase [Alphaproteobacteria bacterium]